MNIPKPKITLLASAPSLADLRVQVNRFYGGQAMQLSELQPHHFWAVIRESDGKCLENVRVARKGQRYRFEMIQW